MLSLIIGLVLFLGIHSVAIVSLDWRNQQAAKNQWLWKGFYAAVSLLGLYFIAVGYATARLEPVVLYTPPYWLRHLTYLLMTLALVLFLAPYLPGKIKRTAKHPQLIAVKLWATSHLLVNGSLADVILFGAFLGWAVLDRISMKKRPQRALPGLKESSFNDILLVIIGLALSFAFICFLHGSLIGVPLMP